MLLAESTRLPMSSNAPTRRQKSRQYLRGQVLAHYEGRLPMLVHGAATFDMRSRHEPPRASVQRRSNRTREADSLKFGDRASRAAKDARQPWSLRDSRASSSGGWSSGSETLHGRVGETHGER